MMAASLDQKKPAERPHMTAPASTTQELEVSCASARTYKSVENGPKNMTPVEAVWLLA
jgi:hypothetical protein